VAAITITTNEIGQLAAVFTIHSARAQSLAHVAARKALLDIEAGAKARAPVDTGFLRNSIRATQYVTAIGGEVVAGANYAHFVEYGTSRMAPKPYMGPAVDAVLPSFEQAIERIAAMDGLL